MSNENLVTLRQEIEKIDKNIIEDLQKRFSLVKEIGVIKKDLGLGVLDEERERELMTKYHDFAKELGVNTYLVVGVFRLIIDQSKKEQEAI
jgi:chorismate mutase